MNLFKNFFKPKPSVEISIDKIIRISEILYPKDFAEFEKLATLYNNDIKKFLEVHESFARRYAISLKKVDLINLLYSFGDSKKHATFIDWKGEENEREIEDFISNLCLKSINWVKTHQFRNENSNIDQNDGHFILNLFKVLDEDLKASNKRLVFFKNNSDAYCFTVISQDDFEKIMKISTSIMISAEKLN